MPYDNERGGITTVKKYLDINVYEATQARLKYIFEHFENIYVSFSGGKDSGLLLNLVLDYKRRHNIQKKIGVFHQDFEAQYQTTTDFVTRMFENNINDIEPYWVCIPQASRCAVSNYQMYWYTWDPDKKAAWVRPMPKQDYIIKLENHNFDFYKYKMPQEDFYAEFGKWYARQHKGKSICLLGIRADESLNRYRAYANYKKPASARANGTPKWVRIFITLIRCMTGQPKMYGLPTASLILITTIFTTSFIRQAFPLTRCVLPVRIMRAPKTA